MCLRLESEALPYIGSIFPADGCAKQLAEGADTEFFLCAPAVSLHAFQTQVQILGDFGNRSPLAEEPEYFHSRSLKRSTGEAPAVLGEALSRRAMLLTTLSLT